MRYRNRWRGYAGLWTALRLREQDPKARITILEADFCGSGASGRNGGQVHSWFAEIDMLRDLVGDEDARMLCHATCDAIEELKVLQDSGIIDMDLRLDGWLWTASSLAQERAWDKARRFAENPRSTRLKHSMRMTLKGALAPAHPMSALSKSGQGRFNPQSLPLAFASLRWQRDCHS